MVRILNLGFLSLVIISLVGTIAASSKEGTDSSTMVLRDNWFIGAFRRCACTRGSDLERRVFHARLVSLPRCPQRFNGSAFWLAG